MLILAELETLAFAHLVTSTSQLPASQFTPPVKAYPRLPEGRPHSHGNSPGLLRPEARQGQHSMGRPGGYRMAA